ncbi:hypothetical protein K445DRAFT_322442 [Daldinia sp. EC12]|nr:hypothetical protein K445DRAFT_322442 [Daldinia sp. EC12]
MAADISPPNGRSIELVFLYAFTLSVYVQHVTYGHDFTRRDGNTYLEHYIFIVLPYPKVISLFA